LSRTSSIYAYFTTSANDFLPFLGALELLMVSLPFLAVVAELSGDKWSLKDSAKFYFFPLLDPFLGV
jgi:hypothetical protein